MTIDEKILAILACPVCKQDLLEKGTEEKSALYCTNCAVYFPIYEGIPILLKKEALSETEWEKYTTTNE